jgi:transcriptional regulator with XRE-family HTH domain
MKFPTLQRAIVSAIAQARKAADLSQRQLSVKLGEPPNWIQRVESLERRVDVAEFIRIARALGIEPSALFARILRNAP